jgi:hypothetical protein
MHSQCPATHQLSRKMNMSKKNYDRMSGGVTLRRNDEPGKITHEEANALAKKHGATNRRNVVSVLMHNQPLAAWSVIRSLQQLCPHWFGSQMIVPLTLP